MEQKITTFLRKWLRLHRSISSLCFYSSASPCPLPIRSLTSVLKSAKISGHLLLRDSKDPLVSSFAPKLKTGQWKVDEAVASTESDMHLNQICGHYQFGRQGLRYIPSNKVPKDKATKAYRKYVSQHHTKIDDTYAVMKQLIVCKESSNYHRIS